MRACGRSSGSCWSRRRTGNARTTDALWWPCLPQSARGSRPRFRPDPGIGNHCSETHAGGSRSDKAGSRHRRRYRMLKEGFGRVVESGVFVWPWTESQGLLVIRGAAGGGGGGGGAFCIEGLNLYGAGGGGGGGGGEATSVKCGNARYLAEGGTGGDGGGGGGLHEGKPVEGTHGKGCHYGDGGEGGRGAAAPPVEGRLASNGGNGGKGFPGETKIVELANLSVGHHFEIKIGKGGGGGGGGKGYETGDPGDDGTDGFVLFVPVHADNGEK